MGKLAIVGASGKLGFATLNALLDYDLISPTDIVCTTSSQSGAEKLEAARKQGVTVCSAEFDNEASFAQPFQGVDKLFLISSARVQMDFNDAPPGKGREADHFRVLAAAKIAGVKHVYYTSLAFANPSLSRVMKAHERTEEHLQSSNFQWTMIREGLYNESWPLYFGHFDAPNDVRNEVLVAGDSKISWTSIDDLGLANALILAAPSPQWVGKTVYLSQSSAHTLEEVAAMVSQALGEETKLKVVSRPEHERFYIEEWDMDEPFVKWWSKTYDALRANECDIDDPTLEELLATKGVKPRAMGETIREMLRTS